MSDSTGSKEEESFDLCFFDIYNPVWHLVSRVSLANPNFRMVVAEGGKEGESFVPVFTDRDLAERALARMNHPDMVALEMECPETWLLFLERLQHDGYERIAFDIEPGQVPRGGTIAYVIEALRKSIREQSKG
jgi:hypothetical protein